MSRPLYPPSFGPKRKEVWGNRFVKEIIPLGNHKVSSRRKRGGRRKLPREDMDHEHMVRRNLAYTAGEVDRLTVRNVRCG